MAKENMVPVMIRMTPKNKKLIETAASKRGMSLSAFVRHACWMVAAWRVGKEKA